MKLDYAGAAEVYFYDRLLAYIAMNLAFVSVGLFDTVKFLQRESVEEDSLECVLRIFLEKYSVKTF